MFLRKKRWSPATVEVGRAATRAGPTRPAVRAVCQMTYDEAPFVWGVSEVQQARALKRLDVMCGCGRPHRQVDTFPVVAGVLFPAPVPPTTSAGR